MSPRCVSKRRKSRLSVLGGLIGFITLAAAFWVWSSNADGWLSLPQFFTEDDLAHKPGTVAGYGYRPKHYIFDIADANSSGQDGRGDSAETDSGAGTGSRTDVGLLPPSDTRPIAAFGPGGIVPPWDPNDSDGTDGNTGQGGAAGVGRGDNAFGFSNSRSDTSGGGTGGSEGPGADSTDKGSDPSGPTTLGDPAAPYSKNTGNTDPDAPSPNETYDPEEGPWNPGFALPVATLLATEIPEPGSLASLIVGLVGAALLRRRRK